MYKIFKKSIILSIVVCNISCIGMDNNLGRAKFIVEPNGTIHKNYGSTQQAQTPVIHRISEEGETSNNFCCRCSCAKEQKDSCYKLMLYSCFFMSVTHHGLSGGH